MAKKLTKRPNGFKNTWGFSDNSGAVVPLSEQKKKAVEDAIAGVKASDKVVKAGKFVKNGKNATLELNLANSKEIVRIDATLIDETQAVEAEKVRAQKAEQANANAVKALEKKMDSEKPVIINTAVSKAKAYTDAKVAAEETRAKSAEKANADAIVEEKTRAEGVEASLDKKIDDVKDSMIKEINIHTKEGVEQIVKVDSDKVRINMGQLNLYHNGEFVRSFAPGLGGSVFSEDGKSAGSFALNFADGKNSKVVLETGSKLPTLKVDVDINNVADVIICDAADDFDATTGKTIPSSEPTGKEVLRFVFKKADGTFSKSDVDMESILTEAEAGDGLVVDKEEGHKLKVLAADETILVNEEGIKVNPELFKEPTVVFDEIADTSSEEMEEIIKALVADLGYDEASKGYINLYKSHNNMSEEEGSSYELVLDLYKEYKDTKGYVNIGGNNIRVEAMSIDENRNWVRFYGHTGPMEGVEVPDEDEVSPLENYVEAVLMGPTYGEDDKYLFDSFVLFRPLQGQAIDAQFIGWSNEELEEAGIYGIEDARVIEPFFNGMGPIGGLLAAFFTYADFYKAVKTDTAFYRLIEAFAEGRSFNAILPSIGDIDKDYKDILEQGIMLKPVVVTDTLATFSAEGTLGHYELVLFNNTEEGGDRGTETKGFLMQYLPDHGTKRCEVRFDDEKGKYYVNDIIFNIINNVAGGSAPINTTKGIILNWEGKDYRFIGENEEGRLSFGTYYSDEGKLIHEFFTTTGETIEIGENVCLEMSFEKILPFEPQSEKYYADFVIDYSEVLPDDIKDDIDIIEHGNPYYVLKGDVTLKNLQEEYEAGKSIYARIVDGDTTLIYELMTFNAYPDSKEWYNAFFFGHKFEESKDNYAEVLMTNVDIEGEEKFLAILAVRSTDASPVFVGLSKKSKGELTPEEKENADNLGTEYYKFSDSDMSIQKVYELIAAGRNVFMVPENIIPLLYRLDSPIILPDNQYLFTFVCHNLAGFGEIIMTNTEGRDAISLTTAKLPTDEEVQEMIDAKKFNVNYSIIEDPEIPEDLKKQLDTEYFVSDYTGGSYFMVNADASLSDIVEKYDKGIDVYSVVTMEDTTYSFKLASITRDEEGVATKATFYGHMYFYGADNYVEITTTDDYSVLGMKATSPINTIIELEKNGVDAEGNTVYKFARDIMSVDMVISMLEMGRDIKFIDDEYFIYHISGKMGPLNIYIFESGSNRTIAIGSGNGTEGITGRVNEKFSEEAIYNAIDAKDEVIAGLETRIAALEDIIKNLTKTEGDDVDNEPESDEDNV